MHIEEDLEPRTFMTGRRAGTRYSKNVVDLMAPAHLAASRLGLAQNYPWHLQHEPRGLFAPQQARQDHLDYGAAAAASSRTIALN
jgi:hypothetical protein